MEETLAEVIEEVVEAVADSAIKAIKNKREAKEIKNEANIKNDFYNKKIKKGKTYVAVNNNYAPTGN